MTSMKIIVLGNDGILGECSRKFHPLKCVPVEEHAAALGECNIDDVIFDFMIADHPDAISAYASRSVTVFLNTCFARLGSLVSPGSTGKAKFFGFSGMPTFVEREHLEVALLDPTHESILSPVCEKLGTAFVKVKDQVGLATPRVVCMIINEAFLSAEEGIASREDIDTAMKLGTNYPYGPFEWCEQIGAANVCRLLEAVYRESGDERYRVAPSLRNKALSKSR
jgi:3-hydroxybutyryl-CoA dehydrogenase